jgi:hypothetical protein
MIVLVVGAPGITTAQPYVSLEELNKHFFSQKSEPEKEWKTFYSQEYKFSLNYPDNKSSITDIYLQGTVFSKQFFTPPFDFVIAVKPSNMDPQESLVMYSQNLPSHFELMDGGKITTIVQDGVVGYLIRAINEQNGTWNYVINCGKNGYLYSFMFSSPFSGPDIDHMDNTVDSIKFFD